MAQQYVQSSADSRNFGDLIGRVLGELHRPDLLSSAPDFIRDAIRYYSRQPFFFNEIDNTAVPVWTASLYVPAGTTIRDTASDGNYYIFVNLVSGLNGAVKPTFTPNLFVPSGSAGIVFTAGQTGTTIDNAITWATVEAWPATKPDVSTFWTQLSTIPATNQYTPPIDYSAPRRVEITAAGHRFSLGKLTYDELRNLDVIRPPPITNYPTLWAWYQKLIYTWPYALGFYPLTLSCYTAPFPPKETKESNFWTTTAEAMIRCYAKGLLNEQEIRDSESAQKDFAAAKREFDALKLQEIEMNATGGIPADSW